MPAGEFKQHYLFWCRFMWGVEHDLLALQASQTIAHRVKGKPIEPYKLKSMAISQGAMQVLKIQPVSAIRAAAEAISKFFRTKK